MACHVGTSKYSRDAHKDKVLQFVCVCAVFRFDNLVVDAIFDKCIFDVANVGRSLAFIGRDVFYR